MRISELIKKLEEIKQKEGDLQVLCTCGEGCDEYVGHIKEDIEILSKNDIISYNTISGKEDYNNDKYLFITAK